MERGLIWLPLLGLFIGLAWAGWNEYQKIETYRGWAQSFEDSKYDIYAVLGLKGNELTWGKPTRKGPVAVQTLSLQTVRSVQLWVDHQIANLESPPEQGRTIALVLDLKTADRSYQIPFTEVALAVQWARQLQVRLGEIQ